MADMFDEIILCSKCNKKMTPIHLVKNGFKIRTLECSRCGKRIYHPADVEEYKKFRNLKQKPFAVKLRMVGNSYTVSIPREIIDFHKEQEHMHQRFVKIQNEMIKMFLEDVGRISLQFSSVEGNGDEEEEREKELKNRARIKVEEEDEE